MDIVLKALIVGAALLIGLASTYLLNLQHDNHIEEIAEDIIHLKTGIDIDISPSSPENRY